MPHQFSFLIPTRNNVAGLQTLFASIVETTADPDALEIVLAIDEDDLDSQKVSHDRLHLNKVVVPKGYTMGALNNACFDASTGRYIMLMNDDVVLRTKDWDRRVSAVFAGFKDDIVLLHVNDLLFRERLCTFPLLSRRACQAVGVCPKAYRRYRIDDHIYDTYNLLAHLGYRRIVYLPEIVFEHENHVSENAPTAGHVFASADNKVYVPKAGIIEEDARYCDEHFADRKQAALQLAEIIEADAHTRARQHLRQRGSARLAALTDSHSYRRPEYLRAQATGVTRDTSNARVTVAVVSADLQGEVARRCVAALKAHTTNYDLLILDNNRGPHFSHSREMNKVLKTIDTEFLVLLDDDVMVEAGWLDGLLRCVDDETGVVVPLHKDGRGQLSFSGVYLTGDGLGTHEHTFDQPTVPRVVQTYCSAALLIDMKKCGHLLMDEGYSKYFFDLVHGFEVWEAGWKAVCCPDVIVTHIGGATVKAGSTEANALLQKDRLTFIKSWVESGRLAHLEAGVWRRHPYLVFLAELPKRIEAFLAAASALDESPFLQQFSELTKDCAPFPLLQHKLRGGLLESVPLFQRKGQFQKIKASLEFNLGGANVRFETPYVVSMADKLFQAKEYRLAESLLLTALQRQPEEIRLWRPLGYVRFVAGDLSGARAAFEQGLNHAPDDIESIDSLGGVFFHLKQPEQAIECFEQALELCRASGATHPRLPELKEKLATARRALPATSASPNLPRPPEAQGSASALPKAHPSPSPSTAFRRKAESASGPATKGAQASGPPRILFLPLELSQWQHARHVSYAAQLGLVEGLRAHGADVLTLPSVFGWPETARRAWWRQVQEHCAGRSFDQVWLDVVHTPWTDEELHWFTSLAPVRVGLVMESLRYDPAVAAQDALLANRHALVTARLRVLTHVLAVDEADVAELNRSSPGRAMWWPQAVPARCLGPLPGSPAEPAAIFAGMVYGKRQAFLQHPALQGLLRHLPSPDDATELPRRFNEVNAAVAAALGGRDSVPANLLTQQAEILRRLRRESFGTWLRALQQGAAVVNLPSLFQGYAGRVFEAMAAGRPVITWDVADRPLTRALFEAEEEVLLFPKNDPAQLAETIRRLQNDPALARRLAENAQRKVKQLHTVERRVRQILDWVATSEQPDFCAVTAGRFQKSAAASPAEPVLTRAEMLQVSTPLTPATAGVMAAFGHALAHTGEEALAQEYLRGVLQQQHDHPNAALGLAGLALRRSDWAACRALLDSVLIQEPATVEGLQLLAELARRCGLNAETKRLREIIAARAPQRGNLTESPSTADSVDPAAAALADEWKPWLARRIEAAAAFTARCQPGAAPDAIPATARLGSLREASELLQKRDYLAAWNSTLRAIEVRPFHPEAFLLLAEIAQAVGDLSKAKQCATRARVLAPKWKAARKFLKALPAENNAAKRNALQAKIPELSSRFISSASRLTVCLITKNEERFLGRCLESVRSAAEQIVVVDTGSTDWTKDIAARFGAEVYSFDWIDDFSAARNAALEHAEGDWVLILDADEEMKPETLAWLKEGMRAENVMAYRLPIVDVGREEEGCSYVPRLFRNAPGLFFVGRVHEQVFTSVEVRRAEWGLESQLGQATLLHHGYSEEVMQARHKGQRNLALLERALAEMPNEPNLLMNYGLELVRAGELRTALEQYWRAFELMSAQPASQIIPEFRETLLTQLATHLLGARDFARVGQVLQSPLAQSAGLTASMHFILGLALMESGQFGEAAEQMRQCLAKRHKPALSPVHKEIRKVAPAHCLAFCLKTLKQTEAASKAFKAALAEDPQSRPLRHDYVRFLADTGQPVEALQCLHRLVTEKPDDLAAWLAGGQIALLRPDFLEFACDWTGEAIKHFPSDRDLLSLRAEALLLNQQIEPALQLWQRWPDSANARHNAALVLCQCLCGGEPRCPSDTERMVSQEFLKWYRKLISYGASAVIGALNGRLGQLKAAVPTASRWLEQALLEAGEEAAV